MEETVVHGSFCYSSYVTAVAMAVAIVSLVEMIVVETTAAGLSFYFFAAVAVTTLVAHAAANNLKQKGAIAPGA